MSIPEGIKFDDKGLIVAIAQNEENGEVLMQAFMNEEALRLSLETGLAHYYSRSRKKLWKKGESSGHVQQVKEVRVDCDLDAVILKVHQIGGACHTGFRSCFYRVINSDGSLHEEGQKVFNPGQVYKT